MFQYCQVDHLIQLEHHSRVESNVLIIANKVKYVSFVKDWFTRYWDQLSMESIFEKTARNRKMLIIPGVYEIYKCFTLHDSAADISLIWI